MSVQFNSNRSKAQNIGFQGLSRDLSRNFVEAGMSQISGKFVTAEEAALEVANKYPKARRFVGSLPHDWIKDIPANFSKEQRKQHVQRIQDLFSELAEKLCTSWTKGKEKDESFVTYFSSQLKQILKKDVAIEYIEQGRMAKAYKLDIGQNSYVFKTFHRDMSQIFRAFHGSTLEPARVPYAKKAGSKVFTDFYFGKIGIKYFKDGFMLTKFEDKDKPISTMQQLMQYLRLITSPVISTDFDVFYGKNLINGKIVDHGALFRQFQNKNTGGIDAKKAIKYLTELLKKECCSSKNRLIDETKTDEIINKIRDLVNLTYPYNKTDARLIYDRI